MDWLEWEQREEKDFLLCTLLYTFQLNYANYLFKIFPVKKLMDQKKKFLWLFIIWNRNSRHACIHICTHASDEFCSTNSTTRFSLTLVRKTGRDHDRSSKCIINAYKPHRISTSMNRAERETRYWRGGSKSSLMSWWSFEF